MSAPAAPKAALTQRPISQLIRCAAADPPAGFKTALATGGGPNLNSSLVCFGGKNKAFAGFTTDNGRLQEVLLQWVCGAIACSNDTTTASNWGCFDRGLSVFLTSADGGNSVGGAPPTYILPLISSPFNLTSDSQDGAATNATRAFYNRPSFTPASVSLPFSPRVPTPAGTNWRLFMGEDLFDERADDNSGCTCAYVHYRLAAGAARANAKQRLGYSLSVHPGAQTHAHRAPALLAPPARPAACLETLPSAACALRGRPVSCASRTPRPAAPT